jgi:hypothetical protein
MNEHVAGLHCGKNATREGYARREREVKNES